MPLPRSSLVLTFVAASILDPTSEGRAEYEFVNDHPEIVVRVPLPCPPDLAKVQVLVGTDGFVHGMHLIGPTPVSLADSAAMDAATKRWIFRPSRDSQGSPLQVWIAIPKKSCDVPGQTGRRLLLRPDERLLERISAADSIFVDGSGGYRSLPPGFISRLLSLLTDSAAYAGPDPRARACIPDPSPAFTLNRRSDPGTTTFWVGSTCDFMQIESPEGVLQVPYGAVRDRMSALLQEAFAAPSSRAPRGKG